MPITETTRSTSTIERRLSVAAHPGVFTEAELAGCEEPVRRYFRAAVAPGTALARAGRIRMRGSIKLANRWVPFRASELLAPLHGYSWPATVAGGLLRGSDTYGDGVAAMTWKLLGLVPVIRAGGPDVARSATGRAAVEGIWVPTALLPRYGVRWRAVDDHRLVADIPFGHDCVPLHLTIDGEGRVCSAHLDRWNDTDGMGRFDWCPFGIEVVASRTFRNGITMPAEGTGGWFQGTDRWSDGQFFRYRIFDLALVPAR